MTVIPIYYCSFCGRSEHSVDVIYTAWEVDARSPSICNNCLDFINEKAAEKKAAATTESNVQNTEGK